MAFRRRKIDPTVRRHPASLTVSEGVVAAVRRFDLTKQADVAAMLAKQRDWQQSAWYYLDEVGELKDCARFVENSFRRVRLYAAFQRDPDAEPIAVADAVRQPDEEAEDDAGQVRDANDYLSQEQADQADAIITSFAARDGGQPILMGKMGQNLFMVGELYIINRDTPTRRPAPGENAADVEKGLDWEVRSRDELRQAQGSKRAGMSDVEIIDSPDQRDGVPIPEEAYVERIWRKHARYSGWADSNVRAAIGTLEEIDLLNRLARSSTRSRILAGLVTMPDELDFGDADQPMSGDPAHRRVGFDREIEEAMAAVISNEADANSVAPLALRGPAEMLKEVRVIEMPRRYGEDERAQHDQAIVKLARTIELPVDRMTGVADVNHWGAWQISEATYEEYIQPLVGIITEALSYGLLRPMLADAGWKPELLDRMIVVADASLLIARPDHGKVATEGYNLSVPAVSGEAWRKANAFGEDDAPSDDELAMRAAFTTGLDQPTSAKVLAELGILPDTIVQAMEEAAASAPTPPGQDEAQPPADGGAPGTEPGPPPVAADRVAVAASAEPRRQNLTALSHADALLASRVQTAVDAAMARAQEKTGARLRSLANKRGEHRGAVATVPNEGVVAALGPGVVASLTNGADLWAGVFDPLRLHWDGWVADAQAVALAAAVQAGTLTNIEANDIRRQQDDHREGGWHWLLAALIAAAALIASGDQEPPAEGEHDPLVVVPPGIVREAMAVAGGEQGLVRSRGGALTTAAGAPAGGVATGADTRRAFAQAGAPWVGYQWVYGDTGERQAPFEPHRALGGVEFGFWNDPVLENTADWPALDHYSPGDHPWCRCSFTPVAEIQK